MIIISVCLSGKCDTEPAAVEHCVHWWLSNMKMSSLSHVFISSAEKTPLYIYLQTGGGLKCTCADVDPSCSSETAPAELAYLSCLFTFWYFLFLLFSSSGPRVKTDMSCCVFYCAGKPWQPQPEPPRCFNGSQRNNRIILNCQRTQTRRAFPP